MSRTTIKDVAYLAGVSSSTVSRVLSNSSSISNETKKRVFDAANKLNYTPNTAARSLRSSSTKSIGVVIPDISGEFYARFASSFLKKAGEKEYSVLFIESSRNINTEKKGVNALLERRVDGIIFMGDNNDSHIIYDILSSSIPVLTCDRKLSEIPSITFNNRETVYKLTELLYKSGFKNFVYLGEPIDCQSNLNERYTGYLEFVSSHNDITYTSVFDEYLHIDKLKGGFDLFNEKIKKIFPDAVITSNDLIAQGILYASYKSGYNIPNDISVTGFDNLISSNYFIPPISTVEQNTEILAKKCFDMIYKLINHENTEDVIIKQKIILRESTDINKKLL